MRYILIPLTLPMFVVGWGYVALMTLTGAAHRWRFDKEQWVLERIARISSLLRVTIITHSAKSSAVGTG